MNRYYVDVRRWRDALQDATELTITCRGMLYVLIRWMNADGSNCYPGRHRIAAYCGLSEPTVDRLLSAAVAAGYLYLSAPGHRGQYAVYAATVPGDRLDEHGKIVRRDVEIAHHQRCANAQKAPHDDRDSASPEPRKRLTSDAPTSVSTTSVSTPPSVSYETGPKFAGANGSDPHEDEDERRSEDEGRQDEDAVDRIAELFGSLTVAEESTAGGMLADGMHTNAVVNTLAAGRRAS